MVSPSSFRSSPFSSHGSGKKSMFLLVILGISIIAVTAISAVLARTNVDTRSQAAQSIPSSKQEIISTSSSNSRVFEVYLDNRQQPPSVRYHSFETTITLTPSSGAVLGLMEDEENYSQDLIAQGNRISISSSPVPATRSAAPTVRPKPSPSPIKLLAESGRLKVYTDLAFSESFTFVSPQITRSEGGRGYQIRISAQIKSTSNPTVQQLLQGRVKAFTIEYASPLNSPQSLIAKSEITRQSIKGFRPPELRVPVELISSRPNNFVTSAPTTSPTVTPTSSSCMPRPACLGGISNGQGGIIYCDPQPGVTYCPASPTPTPALNSRIDWKTTTASLSGESFVITVNGKKFTASGANVRVSSDPGNSTYTTLESIWQENGVEMRMFIYFSYTPGGFWRVTEIRTYDGNTRGDWIYYPGFIGNELGAAHQSSVFDLRSIDGRGRISIRNMKLQAFLLTQVSSGSTPRPQETVSPSGTPLMYPDTSIQY